MKEERTPLEIINELLNLDLAVTFRGDELKGWCPDSDGPGRTSFYLNTHECEKLAEAFARLAPTLERVRVAGCVIPEL